MGDRIRKTGIGIIGDVPWGTHLCQFYKTQEDLLDILIPYFKTGLESNEFCIWVCWNPLRAEEAKASLNKTISNIDNYISGGQIEIVDYSKQYIVHGDSGFDNMKHFWVEKEKLAFERGFEGLRLAGNTYWLERNEWKDFTKYEEEVDAIIRGHKMLAICPYSLDRCGVGEIIDVISNHRFALIRREGKWELIESSERKKAEEALRESEERYRSLVENIKLGVTLIGANRRIIMTNSTIGEWFNKDSQWFVGRECFREFEKRKAVCLHCPGTKAMAIGKPQSVDTMGVRDDGSRFPVRIHAFPLFDSDGSTKRFIEVVEDITERKQAEEKIKLFSRAIEGAIDAKAITDREGIITYINPSMEKLFGYKKGELIGKFVHVLNPDPKMAEYIMSALIKAGSWSGETLQQKKNKEIFPALLSLSTVKDEKGNLIATLGVVRDITDQKQAQEALQRSEEHFRSLIENALDIIGVLKEDGTIKYLSPSVEPMLGYKPKRLLGRSIFKFVHPDDLPNILNIFNNALHKPGVAQSVEVRVRHKDRSWRILEVKGGLHLDPSVRGFVLNATDITERKRAEEELGEKKKKTERLLAELDAAYTKLKETQDELLKREKVETIGVLAAGVAHEIRNPLAIIGMTVQYLQSKLSENDPKRELTEAIAKKVERLDRVTRELSSYGRTMKLNIKKHNLARCLNLNLALIKPKCRVQGIKIKKRYTRHPLIEMDDEQMDKVFLNIMDNAIQVMPKGGVLSISTEFDERAKTAIVRMHNTGSAIPKKHLPRIFEPFYTLKKKEAGTGLGLAIAQSVVLRHSGQIDVESKSSGKDKGVAFIICLPISPPRKNGERTEKI